MTKSQQRAKSLPDWDLEKWKKWKEFQENPLIEHDIGLIGDPQIILPGEYDEYWHMYAHDGAAVCKYKSKDGITWEKEEKITSWSKLGIGPLYLYFESEKWYMFYTKAEREGFERTVICVRESKNLVEWSDEITVLIPELSWELEGKRIQVRNPSLIKINGTYRLYYSGGTVWLDDCEYEEPKYISFAESKNVLGPYRKYGKPILKPDPKVFYRNFGAGAMKVFHWKKQFLGFNNGIYRDKEGKSRSAISLLVSKDGINWIDAPFNPVIYPTTGWKKALVYQLDVVWYKDKVIIYYNARDGWREGIERIGASELCKGS